MGVIFYPILVLIEAINVETITVIRVKVRAPPEVYGEVVPVGIYCRLISNLIKSTPAKILFSRKMQNRDTEPNSKYYLEEYFNIA